MTNHTTIRGPGHVVGAAGYLDLPQQVDGVDVGHLQDCVASGSLSRGAAELLTRMIEAKLAFLISGGTGSGKPTTGLKRDTHAART